MNLEALPIARFCDAVFYWCLQRVEDREKFLFMLSAAIPGREPTERETEAELDDFSSFMSAMGGG